MAEGREHSISGTPYREDLQGLRAIAVLLVVLAHAGWSELEGGFVGVDVFFVLSGYLITGILVRELTGTGKIDLLRFYTRRLRRLLPALLVMVAVSFAVAVLLLSAAEASAQLGSSPYAVSWTSNLFFALRTVDYFDELAVKDLFLHTWSLGVEEQFYLVWPAFLLALYALGARVGGSGERWLLPGVIVAALASLLLCLYWTSTAPEFAFYMMPARIWQLSLGALVYLVTARTVVAVPAGALRGSWMLALGLLLITGSGLLLDNRVAYPGHLALFPSVGAALVILAGSSRRASGWSPLSHPALVWLGDRSYSLYLWHWPVLTLGFSLGFGWRPAEVLGMVLMALLVSVTSYQFIELPFWRGRWSRSRSAVALPACVLVIAAATVLSVDRLAGVQLQAEADDYYAGLGHDRPKIYSMGCDSWYKSDEVEPCEFGDTRAARTAVVIGDSVGIQWFSAIRALFPEPVWRIVVLTKSSCPIVDQPYFYKQIGREFDICDSWRDKLAVEVSGLEADVVVLGSASVYPFSGEEWRRGSERIFASFNETADVMIVIPGTPVLGFDGPGCLDRAARRGEPAAENVCESPGGWESVAHVTDQIEAAASSFANVHVLDLNDLVCPRSVCRAISTEGVPIFRDSSHLTDSFVRSLIPRVSKRLEELLPTGIK